MPGENSTYAGVASFPDRVGVSRPVWVGRGLLDRDPTCGLRRGLEIDYCTLIVVILTHWRRDDVPLYLKRALELDAA